jgi:NTE family protein
VDHPRRSRREAAALRAVPRRPPKIALVLGSGGPRGFAHIGVMKVLEENGVKPDFIIGSSVGAMVGAISASGKSAIELERLSESIRVADFFELGMIGVGKSSGVATQNYVNEHVGGRTIEQLPIAFAAAATRVSDKKLVLFNRGDTGLAVRASSANPDSFNPVQGWERGVSRRRRREPRAHPRGALARGEGRDRDRRVRLCGGRAA